MQENLELRLSAAELVLNHIEKEISDGVLLPGDPLDESSIAKRFAVSRTPVREALLNLSVRGLISIAPRAGIYVARLSIPELASLFELLAELEGACAKLATRRISAAAAEALGRIAASMEAMTEIPEAQAYGKANAEFHENLYAACRNPALMSEIAHIRRRTQVYRQSVFQSQARVRRSREEHVAIAKAVLAGEAERAGQLMIEHISIGGRDFTDFISALPPRLLLAEVVAYPGKTAAERTRQKRETSLTVPPEPARKAPTPSRRATET